MLANFRLKIKQAGTPASKTDLLVFLTNKRFLEETIYSWVSYLPKSFL